MTNAQTGGEQSRLLVLAQFLAIAPLHPYLLWRRMLHPLRLLCQNHSEFSTNKEEPEIESLRFWSMGGAHPDDNNDAKPIICL